MKVCIVTHAFPRASYKHSGIFVYELAQFLTERGHQVHVVTQRFVDTPGWERMGDIQVHRFEYLGWRQAAAVLSDMRHKALFMPSYLIRSLAAVRRTVLEHAVDVVHCYWAIPSGFVGVLAKKLTGAPVVVSVPGSDLNLWASSFLPRQFVRFALRGADRVIALGSELHHAALQLGASPEKTSVIYGDGGIDLELFRPSGQRAPAGLAAELGDSPIAVYVGHLRYPKRPGLIIEAMKEVSSAVPSAKLLVVGDGPERGQLERLRDGLGLGQAVVFCGEQPHEDIPSYLAAARVFVFASGTEGLPSCIMEALAVGKPVVATGVGGIPDLVRHGYNGFLVAPDDVEGFASSLRRLLLDRELAARMGRNANAFARSHLSKEAVLARIEAIYQEVLRGTRGTARRGIETTG